MTFPKNLRSFNAHLKESLINKSGLVFCLIFGILGFSGTSKIPNFGLMGAYQLPHFPDITTGMSILRIWTIVEKFEYSHFGELYFSNNFVYGLFAGYLIYLICNRAINNNNFSKLLLVLPGLLITIFFSASPGPIFDITFAVSLVVCLLYLLDVGEQISPTQIFKLSFWVTLMYMSRPFGMYFALVIYAYFFFKVGKRILPAIAVTVLVMAPFHIIQLNKFDTFTLSTYSGTNLAEALASSGENPSQFLDCKEILGRGNYDTKEMVDCSNINKSKATHLYLTQPTVFLGLFSPKRIVKTFMFANPFWPGTGIDPHPKNVHLIIISIIYYVSLFFTYLIFILNFSKNRFYIFPLIFFSMGLIFPLIGTDGSEAIRIFMPFIAVAYLTVTNKQSNQSLDPQASN